MWLFLLAFCKFSQIQMDIEVYVIDPYHPNIPPQAQMQLGKQILRGFQNSIDYLRDMEFTICECIPNTLLLQHSAERLQDICVHDDALVS